MNEGKGNAMNNHTTDYTLYTVPIPTEQSYYDPLKVCGPERIKTVIENLRSLIGDQFPGITVESWSEGEPSNVRGPDDNVAKDISDWIEDNWTHAL
jgi:hypothetical protein